MARYISSPTQVEAVGNLPKIIKEFFGAVNSQNYNVSIAQMKSPSGWFEPGQTPEFDEYTVVLRGALRVETKQETYDVKAGEAILAPKGEWVRYSSPAETGAEYIAICIPAFSPDTVHRDED